MILCLDVGNSQILAGVLNQEEIISRFRQETLLCGSSDAMGVFLRAVLRENGVDYKQIKAISICSVVPNVDYSIRAACIKYFNQEPFILSPEKSTNLNVKYNRASEVGADRIANAIAAVHYYPDRNIILADLGTATTVCVITKNKDYLGGAITSGMRISMKALQHGTAKLFPVEILTPTVPFGRSTTESLQCGLYFAQLGFLREMIMQIQQSFGPDFNPVIIGTGGFAYLFEKELIFHNIMPDLILQGLRLALELNTAKK